MKKPKPEKREPRPPANAPKRKPDQGKTAARYHLDSVIKRPDME